MRGGYGGLDIWKIHREKPGAQWGKPVNLGPKINTPRNEVFPYIRDNGFLYFSSNGHPGMGGLDIFKAVPKGDSWEVENMKYPLNSSADDFAIIFKGEKEEGFFSSSRKVTNNLIDENGAEITIRSRGKDDIYSFVLPPMEFAIYGTVVDQGSGEAIPNAKVKLVGSDGESVMSNI
jgi:peptidoglycan-associated lipoprotein